MFKAAVSVVYIIHHKIKRVSCTCLIGLIGVLLTSCIVPIPYGSYYHPVYPEQEGYVWIPRDIEGAGPPASLRMKFSGGFMAGCIMDLRADADEENFTLKWLHEEWGKFKTCRINVHNHSLVLEDLDSGSHRNISIFRRVFSGSGPGLDVKQAVDLVSLISGFAAVPISERRYTISIFLERKFDGPLPEASLIQLPAISIAGRLIKPPPLDLKRHVKFLSHQDDYVPVFGRKVTGTTLLSEFGGGFTGSAFVWHEENSLVRLAASFWGTPDSYNGFVRNKDVSEVFGRIYVEVLGGEPLHLMDGQVAWHVPDDKQDHLIPVSKSKWTLEMYTTTNLSERLDHLPDYWQPNKTFDDWLRSFVVVLPGYQPKRFRVTLPRVYANGYEWPIQPIDFEYKSGSVGMWIGP